MTMEKHKEEMARIAGKVALLRKKYRNLTMRERRLRHKVSNLLSQLEEAHLLTKELKDKLSDYKGKYFWYYVIFVIHQSSLQSY